ncbi:MAG: HAD-IB family phosphatase [Chitinophagales bacterium]|nr:HAD-IB family phosphatase [Chitinophagales bacterium]
MKKKLHRRLVFDFDSTLIQVEALDELAQLKGFDKEIQIKIDTLTKAAMNGDISFSESLSSRIDLLQITSRDIEYLVTSLKRKLSVSIQENKHFFLENSPNIYVVSGGFIEYIRPVVETLGILPEHVFANDFLWTGPYAQFNPDNVLSNDLGKVKLLVSLAWAEPFAMIGDGMTDYEVYEYGIAQEFYSYTENISRPSLVQKNHNIITHFSQILLQEYR